ncbi:BCCT family transporter [Vibrio lentus]|nr:BCCT family transporter [Vibrio lentus]
MSFKSKKYSIDSTDHQAGQDNVSKWGMDVHNTVFIASVGLSLLFIITLLALPPADAKVAIDSIKGAVLSKLDFLFMWGANIMLKVAVVLAFSPLGKIRFRYEDVRRRLFDVILTVMLFGQPVWVSGLFSGVLKSQPHSSLTVRHTIRCRTFTEAGRELALGVKPYSTGVFMHGHLWHDGAYSSAYFVYNSAYRYHQVLCFTQYRVNEFGVKQADGSRTNGTGYLSGLATSLALGGTQAASGISHVFYLENNIYLQSNLLSF